MAPPLSSIAAALSRRGCSAQSSAPLAAVAAALASQARPAVYAGFDPTGPSLHVGHLSIIAALSRLQQAGVAPIALIGGATAVIGDPSGRTSARAPMAASVLETNVRGVHSCLTSLLGPGTTILNNASFYEGVGVIPFLRDVGCHFRLGAMLAKESVKLRLVAGEGGEGEPASSSGTTAGMSFTEFTYQLLQANDFLTLHRSHGCGLQIGGSDQWGNITAGIELVRRSEAREVHGVTLPLVMGEGGKKIGKSEGNAVWLDPSLTPHHEFYQHLLSVPDDAAPSLLWGLTDLPGEVIEEHVALAASKPETRPCQRLLADTVTGWVRGAEG